MKVRKSKRSGNFLISLIFNILLNFEGIVPALALLVLHFWLKISIWWSVAALVLWLLWIILWTLFMSWANKCGNTPDKPKENKNPYSAGNKENGTVKGGNADEKH